MIARRVAQTDRVYRLSECRGERRTVGLGVDVSAPPPAPDDREEFARVLAAVARLPDRLRLVVERRYGLGGAAPATLKEIGAGLGLTRERVRQLEAEALAALREALAPAAGVKPAVPLPPPRPTPPPVPQPIRTPGRRGRGSGGVELLPSGSFRAARAVGGKRVRRTFATEAEAAAWLADPSAGRVGPRG